MSSPYTVGIDLGGTKIETAIVDADGTVLESARRPTRADRSADRILDDIAASVEDDLNGALDRAAAVGIGVAGQVDTGAGVVRTSPNLGWTDVPLQERLEAAFDCPVAVTNDVRAITWGVWQHGAGKGVDDLVVIFVGTGIGGSVVSGGTMLDGHQGIAGELGHMPIVAEGRSCHCPNEGCWEAYAGGWALEERAREAVQADPEAGQALLDRAGGRLDDMTGRVVHAAADEGEALAQDLVYETGRYLGIGMTGIVNVFNPKRIVLGGGVIEGHSPYVEQVRHIVHEQALQVATESLSIVSSDLGERAGVIGAATMAQRGLERFEASNSTRKEEL